MKPKNGKKLPIDEYVIDPLRKSAFRSLRAIPKETMDIMRLRLGALSEESELKTGESKRHKLN